MVSSYTILNHLITAYTEALTLVSWFICEYTIPWSRSCLIRVDVYGPWWLLVTEAQEISLESSLARRDRTEVSLSSFSSDFPSLNQIFLCNYLPPKRVVTSAPDTAYSEVSFCLASHPLCVYGSTSHLFAVPCAYFVLWQHLLLGCLLPAATPISSLVITLLRYCQATPSHYYYIPLLVALF